MINNDNFTVINGNLNTLLSAIEEAIFDSIEKSDVERVPAQDDVSRITDILDTFLNKISKTNEPDRLEPSVFRTPAPTIQPTQNKLGSSLLDLISEVNSNQEILGDTQETLVQYLKDLDFQSSLVQKTLKTLNLSQSQVESYLSSVGDGTNSDYWNKKFKEFVRVLDLSQDRTQQTLIKEYRELVSRDSKLQANPNIHNLIKILSTKWETISEQNKHDLEQYLKSTQNNSVDTINIVKRLFNDIIKVESDSTVKNVTNATNQSNSGVQSDNVKDDVTSTTNKSDYTTTDISTQNNSNTPDVKTVSDSTTNVSNANAQSNLYNVTNAQNKSDSAVENQSDNVKNVTTDNQTDNAVQTDNVTNVSIGNQSDSAAQNKFDNATNVKTESVVNRTQNKPDSAQSNNIEVSNNARSNNSVTKSNNSVTDNAQSTADNLTLISAHNELLDTLISAQNDVESSLARQIEQNSVSTNNQSVQPQVTNNVTTQGLNTTTKQGTVTNSQTRLNDSNNATNPRSQRLDSSDYSSNTIDLNTPIQGLNAVTYSLDSSIQDLDSNLSTTNSLNSNTPIDSNVSIQGAQGLDSSRHDGLNDVTNRLDSSRPNVATQGLNVATHSLDSSVSNSNSIDLNTHTHGLNAPTNNLDSSNATTTSRINLDSNRASLDSSRLETSVLEEQTKSNTVFNDILKNLHLLNDSVITKAIDHVTQKITEMRSSSSHKTDYNEEMVTRFRESTTQTDSSANNTANLLVQITDFFEKNALNTTGISGFLTDLAKFEPNLERLVDHLETTPPKMEEYHYKKNQTDLIVDEIKETEEVTRHLKDLEEWYLKNRKQLELDTKTNSEYVERQTTTLEYVTDILGVNMIPALETATQKAMEKFKDLESNKFEEQYLKKVESLEETYLLELKKLVDSGKITNARLESLSKMTKENLSALQSIENNTETLDSMNRAIDDMTKEKMSDLHKESSKELTKISKRANFARSVLSYSGADDIPILNTILTKHINKKEQEQRFKVENEQKSKQMAYYEAASKLKRDPTKLRDSVNAAKSKATTPFMQNKLKNSVVKTALESTASSSLMGTVGSVAATLGLSALGINQAGGVVDKVKDWAGMSKPATDASKVANVVTDASKAANVTNVAKTATAASELGQAANVANTTSAVSQASNVSNVTNAASQASNVTNAVSKTATVASELGQAANVTNAASQASNVATVASEAGQSSSLLGKVGTMSKGVLGVASKFAMPLTAATALYDNAGEIAEKGSIQASTVATKLGNNLGDAFSLSDPLFSWKRVGGLLGAATNVTADAPMMVGSKIGEGVRGLSNMVMGDKASTSIADSFFGLFSSQGNNQSNAEIEQAKEIQAFKKKQIIDKIQAEEKAKDADRQAKINETAKALETPSDIKPYERADTPKTIISAQDDSYKNAVIPKPVNGTNDLAAFERPDKPNAQDDSYKNPEVTRQLKKDLVAQNKTDSSQAPSTTDGLNTNPKPIYEENEYFNSHKLERNGIEYGVQTVNSNKLLNDAIQNASINSNVQDSKAQSTSPPIVINNTSKGKMPNNPISGVQAPLYTRNDESTIQLIAKQLFGKTFI